MFDNKNIKPPTPLESIIELARNLQVERNIPQFLFIDGIGYRQTIQVRESVDKFVLENPNIKEIDIILESPGGSADQAYRIIRTFQKRFERVNIVVPFWAKSAATLLALGGTEIIMNEFGEFGPLDTQLKVDDAEKPEIETQSALIDEQSLKRIEREATELYQTMYGSFTESSDKKVRINRTVLSSQILTFVAEFYKPLVSKIDPIAIGTKRRYLDIAEQYATRLMLAYNPSGPKAIQLFIDYLVNECPDHGYVIDFDLVAIFLKNVTKSIDKGKNYDDTLTQISKIFIAENVDSYVGFIKQSNISVLDPTELVQKEKEEVNVPKQPRQPRAIKRKNSQ